jgi:hypothetical protein
VGLASCWREGPALDAAEVEPAADEPVARMQARRPGDRPEQAAHRSGSLRMAADRRALDWILVRPAVWVVRREPFRTIFGYED